MSGSGSERKKADRFAACYGGLCAATLGAAVLLMGRATFEDGRAQAGPGAARDLPQARAFERPHGDSDPRFASWTAAAMQTPAGGEAPSPYRSFSP